VVDNTQLNPGFGGDDIRTIDEDGVKTEVVLQGSKQSTANSTTTNLSASTIFTGDWELNIYPDVQVFCLSNVSGDLHIEFSDDGLTTHEEIEFPIVGGVSQRHTRVKAQQYFRVVYFNGLTDQSSFRLSSYFGNYHDNVVSLDKILSQREDAQLVRAIVEQSAINPIFISQDIEVFKQISKQLSQVLQHLEVITDHTFED